MKYSANLLNMAHYLGKIILLFSALMLIPLITSVFFLEWNTVFDFLNSMGILGIVGTILLLYSPQSIGQLSWKLGMVIVALSWLTAMMLGALPYYFSGFWLSYLDCTFDVMSGLTTTGLSLVQDMEHIPYGINMWRFILTWLGGQGMIVLALVFLMRGLPGAFRIYVGEGKDERLLPNVTHTAKAIWYISVVYMLIGTLSLGITGLLIGQGPVRAFMHGMWISMSAWSTGGFAPQVQSINYYHSLAYETVTMIFFIIGSLNFNLHWAIWTGNRKEIYKNLEAVTFFTTSTILVTVALWELSKQGVYSSTLALFRRGYYTMLSAHTTTGFMTTYAQQFITEWGPLAMVAIFLAMLFGGSASSTAGGFKAVRIGLAFKAVLHDVKQLLAPERAIVVDRFHMGKDIKVEDRFTRPALTIIFLYFILWSITSLVTSANGFSLPEAMFEAASVTGNVGLSAGVTSAALPPVVKIMYILAMYLGRLEFLSFFVLAGYILSKLRRR